MLMAARSRRQYTTLSDTYRIAATYCEPDTGPSQTVQLLTHGIGFDRTYWDLAYNGHNYSYVARAVDEYGYSTFAWDRLGIAQSQHGEPINEIQSSLEIAALYALTTRLRAGALPGVAAAFDKVVHVGHSFGSIQSYSLAVLHPDASDGLVLTGFSQQSAFLPYFAFASNFRAAADDRDNASACYPAGYLALGNARALQANFFTPGNFDPELLRLAFASGQPVTVGELLTLGAQTSVSNPFMGPVLVITGGRDLPFCGGDCNITGDASLPNYLELTRPFFPNASTFDAVVVGDAGHGLNLVCIPSSSDMQGCKRCDYITNTLHLGRSIHILSPTTPS